MRLPTSPKQALLSKRNVSLWAVQAPWVALFVVGLPGGFRLPVRRDTREVVAVHRLGAFLMQRVREIAAKAKADKRAKKARRRPR